MSYLVAFILAAALSYVLTPVAKKIAFKIGAIDLPGERKIHAKPIARFGGLAIFVPFVILVLFNLRISRSLIALLAAAFILLVVGIVDDIRGLSPGVKLVCQIVAAGVALAGGIGIIRLSNPWGGAIPLDAGRFAWEWGGIKFHITPIANTLSILWMVGVINVINFLDGLDGLAAGVSGIAAFIIFLLAVSAKVAQPEVALISIVLAGALVGFLPFNFFPAKIFLGDGGAYFLGIVLAMLAIYSGGKLATASLVLGFTIIDGLWTVFRRLRAGKSIFKADSRHFHHMLLEAGLSHRASVLLLYGISLMFGLIAVWGGSKIKTLAAASLAILVFAAIWFLTRRAIKPEASKKP